MSELQLRPARYDDCAAVDAIHEQAWGGPYVVGHGVRYDLRTLPTVVAVDDGAVVGALAWHVDGDALEIVSIAAAAPRRGIGSALLAAAVAAAQRLGVRRVWLITTNDNLRALRFYQRRGLRLVGVDPGAVDRARRLKPGIPMVGAHGIPLYDELTLEMRLDPLGVSDEGTPG
jgi:ribosomal protein S18 acetylase RimI-like enzyme